MRRRRPNAHRETAVGIRGSIETGTELQNGLRIRTRLLAATIGSAETKFPACSSPAVSAMNMGATTTTQPSDEPPALATSKAVPAIKAG